MSQLALATTAPDGSSSPAADAIVEVMSQTRQIGSFFGNLWDAFLRYLPTLLLAIGILALGALVTKLALRVMQRGLNRTKIDLTVNKFLMSTATVVFYVVLFIVVLSVMGIPTTSLVTVIGTAGLAIGLALQDSLANVAGGFLILINKPFLVGEFIEIAGVSGTVDAIGVLYTQLNTADNKAVFIPNKQAANSTLVNHSRNGVRRIDLTFGIPYEADPREALRAIASVLDAHPRVLAEPIAVVRVAEYASSAVNIVARPWCALADYWDVRFDLIEQVRAALEARGITIPYDKLDVHVVAPPT